MSPEEIRGHLRTQPFRPFTVRLSNGETYDVPHPEMAMVTRRALIIAIDSGSDELPEQSVWCDPVHVVSITPSNGSRKSGS